MVQPTHIPEPEEATSDKAQPVYFLTIPELAYKALSDAAARKNLTIAQLVAKALSDCIKSEGV